VHDKFSDFFKGAGIQQQVHPFAGREFALLMLGFNAVCAAAQQGLGIFLFQYLYFV
jgi:hypothetical protein